MLTVGKFFKVYNQGVENKETPLASRLRGLRKNEGLTVAALAALANLSPQIIKDIEAGRRVGGLESVLALSRAFGLSVEEFLQTDKRAHPQPLPMSRIASRIGLIPDRVFELAESLGGDPDKWRDAIAALEREEEKIAKKLKANRA